MRVLDFIVCEDIRHEVGNKFSLMGVFNDRMSVNNAESGKPFRLRFGLYARVLLEANDSLPDTVRLTIRRADDVLFSGSNPMQFDGDGSKKRLVIVAILEQRFQEFGEHTFEMALYSGDTQVGQAFSQTIDISGSETGEQVGA